MAFTGGWDSQGVSKARIATMIGITGYVSSPTTPASNAIDAAFNSVTLQDIFDAADWPEKRQTAEVLAVRIDSSSAGEMVYNMHLNTKLSGNRILAIMHDRQDEPGNDPTLDISEKWYNRHVTQPVPFLTVLTEGPLLDAKMALPDYKPSEKVLVEYVAYQPVVITGPMREAAASIIAANACAQINGRSGQQTVFLQRYQGIVASIKPMEPSQLSIIPAPRTVSLKSFLPLYQDYVEVRDYGREPGDQFL